MDEIPPDWDDFDFNDDPEPEPATQVALPILGDPVHYTYDGVTIQFPKTAYVSQEMLMEKVIKGVRNGENCLLESPTGTGKTLALLCPVLAWVEKCKKEEQSYQNIPAIEDGPCECGFDVHEDCRIIQDASTMRIWDRSSYPSLIRIRTTQVVDWNPENSMEAEETQTSVEYADTQFSAWASETLQTSMSNPQEVLERRTVDEICVRCRLKYFKRRSPPPRIYYTTRTVSQSKANVSQLMATHYRNRVKMTILASREKTCVEESLLERRNAGVENLSIDDECATRRKNFYFNQKHQLQTNGSSGEVPQPSSKKMAVARTPICKYFHQLQEMKPSFESWQEDNRVWDIEDLRRDAKAMSMCPYYGATLMHDKAEIIFCTYNYLIFKHIRRFSRMDLLNSVVIFDEAHNIEDTCKKAASKTVSYSILLSIIFKLDDSARKHSLPHAPNQHDDEYNRLVVGISITLKRLRDWIVGAGQTIHFGQSVLRPTAKKVFTTAEIRAELEKENVQLGQESWIELGDRMSKLDVMEGGGEKGEVILNQDIKIEHRTGQFVKHLVDVFEFVFSDDPTSSDFDICLEKSRSARQQATLAAYSRTPGGVQAIGSKQPRLDEDQREYEYDLKVICHNPALAFQHIKKLARTIIVASGTLSPMDAIQSELNTRFPLQLIAPHVIPDSNAWVGIVHKSLSPMKPSLKLTRDTQESPSTQDELGSIILKICQVVPFGVLVFLSSYSFLDKLRNRWSTQVEDCSLPPMLQQLKELKRVFYESRNEQECRRDIAEYKRISVTTEGAIFFGVFRGKVSEGVDFADDQARAVVTLGIPLLNFGAPEVQLKMSYNTRKLKEHLTQNPFIDRRNSIQPLTDQKWYEAQGYRALNQGFGRAIRHSKDWGAIYIIEKRFEHAASSARKQLPDWVNRNAQTFDSVESSIINLKQFMKKKMQDRLPTQSLPNF